jgi:hypothetical protein
MTVEIQEGNLSFSFEFDAIKFDDSQYYRKHFITIKNDLAAIDILAVNASIGYLIEVKDYTHQNTENLSQNYLIEAVINKVISTLSAILPMKNNANIATEKQIAALFSKTNDIKVFLHIELPPPTSKLEQSTWRFSNIQMKLKNKLKPIDAHPKVVSKESLKNLPWTVTTK